MAYHISYLEYWLSLARIKYERSTQLDFEGNLFRDKFNAMIEALSAIRIL